MNRIILLVVGGCASSTIAFAQTAPESQEAIVTPPAAKTAPPTLPSKFEGRWQRVSADMGSRQIGNKTEFIITEQADGKVKGKFWLWNAFRPVNLCDAVLDRPFEATWEGDTLTVVTKLEGCVDRTYRLKRATEHFFEVRSPIDPSWTAYYDPTK